MRPKKPITINSNGYGEIPLRDGLVAIIDAIDIPTASSYGWTVDTTKPNFYVQTCGGSPRKTIRLHRYLLDAPSGILVDHINGNGLDNRRSNLRLCTIAQNVLNRRKIKAKTSIYKGVFQRENGKWRATIRVSGKLINIGTFEVELDAAAAYNDYATKYFGEFACLNQLPSYYPMFITT